MLEMIVVVVVVVGRRQENVQALHQSRHVSHSNDKIGNKLKLYPRKSPQTPCISNLFTFKFIPLQSVRVHKEVRNPCIKKHYQYGSKFCL